MDHECIFCWRTAESWHHVRISAINCGMGTKPHDWFKIPVCGAMGTLGCHRECQEYLIAVGEQCLKVIQFRLGGPREKEVRNETRGDKSSIIEITMEEYRMAA